MKTKVFIGVVTLAVCLILTGCRSASASFDYQRNTFGMLSFKSDIKLSKSVAVLPVEDARDRKYTDPLGKSEEKAHPSGNHGSRWLGMIPFMPAGIIEKEKPDENPGFITLRFYQLNIPNDYGNAVYQSILNSNLFTDVRYGAANKSSADYIWRSRVTNTYYSGGVYSYFITYIFAAPLWVLGAPYGISENELKIEFELFDQKQKKVVWKYHYSGRDYRLHWIYGLRGKDVSMYSQLLRKAINKALGELARVSADF